MLQTAFQKKFRLIPFILLLLFLLGRCFLPAQAQHSVSDSTSPDRSPISADKTSDLSGLWLLPQINNSLHDKLQSKGITLTKREIYNPEGSSLNKAIAKIMIGDSQAGSGSFVSSKGLLLTNYHTAIQGIAQNSNRTQNYIHNGFYAEPSGQEIPLDNYRLLISIEQKEVTDQINQQLSDSLTYRQRRQQKQKIKKKVIAKRQSGNNNLVVEINDTWSGNRQFMSVYKVIRDVRLVHATPNPNLNRSSTYAFLKAYVSPNGQSKRYNKTNIPFKPQKHLTIAEREANVQDITLTLGFSGETQRYESSYAIEFYQNNRNPVLIDMYKAILDAARYAAREDSTKAIKNAPLRSSIAHNLTYYRAIQHSIEEHNIIKKKQTAQEGFSEWIKQDSVRNIKYRRVLSQLDQSYRIASQTGDLLFALVNAINNNQLLQIASLYNSYYEHISDSTKTVNKQALLQQHQDIINNINHEAQAMMLEDMLYSLATLPDGKVPFYLIELWGGDRDSALKQRIHSYVQKQRNKSIIFNPNHAEQFLNLPIDSIRNHSKDELVTLYGELLNSYQFSRQNYSQHVPYLQPAQELYVQGLFNFQSDSITYPDANGTLRLSIGQIKEMQTNKKSDHKSMEGRSKIADFISTNDISGGSFGSPVLNTNGELIGMVTHRRSRSMANDLLFQPELSRTINLDIRHIISQISEFNNGESLLKEMQILETITD